MSPARKDEPVMPTDGMIICFQKIISGIYLPQPLRSAHQCEEDQLPRIRIHGLECSNASAITGKLKNRKTVNRARLFSRDRLNTTEYMNNLATLDRRLAIDEILEKRKRAIFEPQLLHENVYTDEVFVDVSRIPKSARDSHDYEELDHRKCLLQMQEHQ
ncbi:hypothetical protein AVEN_235733-1 [Araneus ventricosus]|uniref:Uncharacterized protein n=1 Tax=Araneus ventricosus TaxID=182803 RepID=A0A4Y2HMQ4_ARAVE|nr:hypothetical protein AVEN_235733-1 [Araneus ventricosus]